MPATPETTAAFHDLMETVSTLDSRFFEGDSALGDEQSVLEGYKWVFSILQVATDVYLWGDADNPRFVDIVGPYKKWGGDNSDAFYQFFPVDPDRVYRVSGVRGDAVYLSLTVYGGPDDGRYSERIVGIVNDRDLDFTPDGGFEIMLGRNRPSGYDGAFIELADDAVAAVTRDYMNDPDDGRRVEWKVEAIDPPATVRLEDAEVARRLRAVKTWIDIQSAMVPIPLGDLNQIDDPYPVPEVTYGWAAGDAAYAMGAFELADDKALVIDGIYPDCVFWNVCLWNQFLHTYNYDYDRCTLNGGQATPNADGSWTIVVAHRDPGHPNWINPQGHPRGRIWFRWFHPDATPAPLSTTVVDVDDVPNHTV